MIKASLCLIQLLLLILLFQNTTWAGDAEGRKLFNQTCHHCHTSSQVRVNPVQKAASQWDYFFRKQKHQRRYNISMSEGLSQLELEMILYYLKNHASDSDQPEVAGQR